MADRPIRLLEPKAGLSSAFGISDGRNAHVTELAGLVTIDGDSAGREPLDLGEVCHEDIWMDPLCALLHRFTSG